MVRTIPTVDFQLALSELEQDRETFVQDVGNALKDIGFFALINHGIPRSLIDETYRQCDAFFDLDEATKRTYLQPTSVATRLSGSSTPKITQHLI